MRLQMKSSEMSEQRKKRDRWKKSERRLELGLQRRLGENLMEAGSHWKWASETRMEVGLIGEAGSCTKS